MSHNYNCKVIVDNVTKTLCNSVKDQCFYFQLIFISQLSLRMVQFIQIRHYIICNPAEINCVNQYHNITFPCYWDNIHMKFSINRFDMTQTSMYLFFITITIRLYP